MIEDMHKLALQPGEKIIHVLPEEYIVDNEPGFKNPIGMTGARLETNFHVITRSNSSYTKYLSLC